MNFDYVFYQTCRRKLYDGHIWLSVFTRPVQSTYTRVQRLTTCLTILMMTMLSNAMFYTGGMELALRKICQNTGHRKIVFWHVLRIVEFMLSTNEIINSNKQMNKKYQKTMFIHFFISLLFH